MLQGRQLGLTSKLALLAIDPENGRLRGAVGYALAAAALLELMLRGRVAILGQVVQVNDERPTGDVVLDEALCQMIETRQARPAAYWIRTLGRRRDLRERIIRSLEGDGLIRRCDGRMAIFPAERYVVIPTRLRTYLVARIRATLLGSHDEATADDVTLAVLLASTGMLDRFFGRDERELASLRAGSLVRDDRTRSTVAAAVSQMQILAIAVGASSRAHAGAS